jgi:hypothetical protein
MATRTSFERVEIAMRAQIENKATRGVTSAWISRSRSWRW